MKGKIYVNIKLDYKRFKFSGFHLNEKKSFFFT